MRGDDFEIAGGATKSASRTRRGGENVKQREKGERREGGKRIGHPMISSSRFSKVLFSILHIVSDSCLPLQPPPAVASPARTRSAAESRLKSARAWRRERGEEDRRRDERREVGSEMVPARTS
eukprot:768132-Hanusia_phi.AAC.5